MSDTKVTESTSSLRVYEANMEVAGMNQLTKTQMLQIIAEQQSAQGDKVSATALQAIREKKAADEAASLRSMVSTGLLITGGLFGIVGAASSLPGMVKPGNPVGLGRLNAYLFKSEAIVDNDKLRKVAQQASQFWGQGNSLAQTGDKIISSRNQATQVELRSEQSISQSEEGTKQSERQRKLQREDQVNNQLSQQQSQEFATKKAIVVTGG